MSAGDKRVGVSLSADLYIRFKVAVAKNRTDMQSALELLVERYVKRSETDSLPPELRPGTDAPPRNSVGPQQVQAPPLAERRAKDAARLQSYNERSGRNLSTYDPGEE